MLNISKCSCCLELKENHEYKRGHRQCHECLLIKKRTWIEQNRERVNELNRRNYSNGSSGRSKAGRIRRLEENPVLEKSRILLRNMRVRAKVKGHAFDETLSLDYIARWLTQQDRCESCYQPFQYWHSLKKPHPRSPTIDRVDSCKGYTEDNVALLCWRCNTLKSDASLTEIRMIMQYMEGKLG
jgi:hypothetical protein